MYTWPTRPNLNPLAAALVAHLTHDLTSHQEDSVSSSVNGEELEVRVVLHICLFFDRQKI